VGEPRTGCLPRGAFPRRPGAIPTAIPAQTVTCLSGRSTESFFAQFSFFPCNRKGGAYTAVVRFSKARACSSRGSWRRPISLRRTNQDVLFERLVVFSSAPAPFVVNRLMQRTKALGHVVVYGPRVTVAQAASYQGQQLRSYSGPVGARSDAPLQAAPSPPGRHELLHPFLALAWPTFRRSR
jgi:hypothetical protein